MSNPNLLQSVRGIPASLAKWLANPVVVRDLRAQMRGVKSFAFIGIYLLILSLIAVAGYATATGQSLNPLVWENSTRNIVDAQANLGTFRYFIFGTLALMVTIIAPALTAASVVSERQRQSFDLLVTTPLTASQLLIGKLLSSVAFLGFLMLLSLPATALCVILGGSTLDDVLRYYFLLAVDGVVLSAIGLYFSCTARVPLAATVWTTLAVLGFLWVTITGGVIAMNGNTFPLTLEPFISIVWLNPAAAIIQIANGEGTGPILLLRLAVFLGIATLVVRILLAAATYRLGLFGAGSAITLRRESLILAAIVAGFLSNSQARGVFDRATNIGQEQWLHTFGTLPIFALVAVLPFLAGLFVPASAEDAPPGLTPETAADPNRSGLFNSRRLFFPEHSGALPWYVAYVLTVMGSIFVGVLPYPKIWGYTGLTVIAGIAFLFGIGFLLWGLARLAGNLAQEISATRGLAFVLFASALGLPTLFLSLTGAEWQYNPLATLWLLSPLVYKENLRTIEALFREALLSGSLGVVAFLIDQALRSRFRSGISLTRTAE